MTCCVYITIYKGNKLPPFYIGSCSDIKKINNGYHGSVSSIRYKSIWKQELKDHPELFKTIILSKYETYGEALQREEYLHYLFDVANNPMYINMSNGSGRFGVAGEDHPRPMKGRQLTNEHKMKLGKKGSLNPFYGKTHTPEAKALIIKANLGKKHSSATKSLMSLQRQGRTLTKEHIERTAAGNRGKKRTIESRKKMSIARIGKIPWNKGISCSQETKRKISETKLRKNNDS